MDTNVPLDILTPNPEWFERSLKCIQSAAGRGSLALCDPAYAELCAHFRVQAECDAFLAENDIRVERIDRESAFAASEAWRLYRRAGGRRERILPDFLIGAHALRQAGCLISRDAGFYRQYLRGLEVIEP